MAGAARESLKDLVASSGLVGSSGSAVALCSGGADSAALVAGLAGHWGPERVVALHLNYGLRDDSDRDQAACEKLCDLLGVEPVVERVRLPAEGNLQAQARDARYAAAEALRAERGFDWVATGHTRTDLAETVIYRLVSSPGTRSLLGLPARRGRIVRPLLGVGRTELRALVRDAGLPFRDDPSNESADYARNRIRAEVLPVLEEIAPAAERTIAETRAELGEEAEALEAVVAEELERSGAAAAGAIAFERLEQLGPALMRLVLRALAERASGRRVALGRARAAEIVRLAADPEGGVVELGGAVEARIEHGHVRFATAGEPDPGEALLTVPGSCRFGRWEVRATVGRGREPVADPETAVLDPDALRAPLVVRAWREGDRIRPLGLGGSKSLQDLFTDRKVPRSLRRSLPVVTSGDRVAWIAGVAVSEEFAAPAEAERVAVISAARVER
jgi:tRNA(Ile)-lysidine synthase